MTREGVTVGAGAVAVAAALRPAEEEQETMEDPSFENDANDEEDAQIIMNRGRHEDDPKASASVDGHASRSLTFGGLKVAVDDDAAAQQKLSTTSDNREAGESRAQGMLTAGDSLIDNDKQAVAAVGLSANYILSNNTNNGRKRSARPSVKAADGGASGRKKQRRNGPCRSRASKKFSRWNERLDQWKAYKREHGNCLVPQRFSPYPSLGNRVQNQQKADRRMKEAKCCGSRLAPGAQQISDDRISQLENMGFQWSPRNSVLWNERQDTEDRTL